MKTSSCLHAALLPASCLAATVTIAQPQATVIGTSAGGVDSFRGIPFAVPPVNELRLTTPKPLTSPLGLVNATQSPQRCPQFQAQTTVSTVTDIAMKGQDMSFVHSPMAIVAPASVSAEDCLTINVQRPSTATADSKLPVVFWIYGGGFEFGSTNDNDGAGLVNASIANGHPIIYVQANYRVAAWGFLAGKEVQDAGISNLGHLDQRLAMQWTADNIAAFGGDPEKVTIWGESAGSISVFNQMALYNGNNIYKGKPLFRAALMDSGSIVPSNPVNCTKAQNIYDTVVARTNCSTASNTLACLRSLPYETFFQAANSVPAVLGYNSVALSYLPRPDGVVLTDSPELLAEAGYYTDVPFIIGDQQDEGTVFSTAQKNISTTHDLVHYLHTIFFPDFPKSRVEGLVHTYPNHPAAGSPFGTGQAGEVYPQYKRVAALLGDITFTLSRRAFLAVNRNIRPKTPSWSYLATYLHLRSGLGTYHGSDVPVVYGGAGPSFYATSQRNYYLSFFNTMDPNAQLPSNMTYWPRWNHAKNEARYGLLLNLGNVSNTILADNFRNNSYTYLVQPENVLRI